MKLYLSLMLLLLSALLFYNSASAQKTSKNNFELGLSAGTTIYQGDIAPSAFGSYKRLHPSFSLYAGKWLGQYFLLQAVYTHANITAHDSDWSHPAFKKIRNLTFKSSVDEIYARVLFSPFGNINYTPDKKWYPYAFAGAGVAFTHVQRNWSGIDTSFLTAKNLKNLSDDSAHRVPASIPAIPFGAGVRYALSPNLSLFAEATYRMPVTDYLDGFSYLGNPRRKDNYYNYSVGLNFSLSGNNGKCPKARM